MPNDTRITSDELDEHESRMDWVRTTPNGERIVQTYERKEEEQ